MTSEIGVDELVVSKVVPAAPAAVFQAWTNAEVLAQWWRPPGGTCHGAEFDLRAGGMYKIVNGLPDGSTVTIAGEFLEIVAPESLSYTWGVDATGDPEEFVSVRFESHHEGTLVTVRHERIPTTEVREGHRLGWHSCLDGLGTYFA